MDLRHPIRDDNDIQCVYDEHHADMDELLIYLQNKAEDIKLHYKGMRDAYNRYEKDKDYNSRQYSYLGVIIRLQTNSLSIQWVKYIHYDKKSKKPHSDYLSKPSGRLRYSNRELKKYAQPWELGFILDAEDQFAKIRKQVAAIAKWRRALNHAHRLLD